MIHQEMAISVLLGMSWLASIVSKLASRTVYLRNGRPEPRLWKRLRRNHYMLGTTTSNLSVVHALQYIKGDVKDLACYAYSFSCPAHVMYPRVED